MREWILWNAKYFLSQWQSLLIGGVVVVSVIIFVMGILKKLLINRVKSDLLRKVLLAWLSVILTLPATAVSVIYNGYDFSYFWGIYIVNTVSTILIYWFYENTAIRDALALIGKKVVTRILKSSEKDLSDLVAKVNKDTEALLSNKKSKSVYKDDDLKNL